MGGRWGGDGCRWVVIQIGGDFGSLGADFASFVFVIIKCNL